MVSWSEMGHKRWIKNEFFLGTANLGIPNAKVPKYQTPKTLCMRKSRDKVNRYVKTNCLEQIWLYVELWNILARPLPSWETKSFFPTLHIKFKLYKQFVFALDKK